MSTAPEPKIILQALTKGVVGDPHAGLETAPADRGRRAPLLVRPPRLPRGNCLATRPVGERPWHALHDRKSTAPMGLRTPVPCRRPSGSPHGSSPRGPAGTRTPHSRCPGRSPSPPTPTAPTIEASRSSRTAVPIGSLSGLPHGVHPYAHNPPYTTRDGTGSRAGHSWRSGGWCGWGAADGQTWQVQPLCCTAIGPQPAS